MFSFSFPFCLLLSLHYHSFYHPVTVIANLTKQHFPLAVFSMNERNSLPSNDKTKKFFFCLIELFIFNLLSISFQADILHSFLSESNSNTQGCSWTLSVVRFYCSTTQSDSEDKRFRLGQLVQQFGSFCVFPVHLYNTVCSLLFLLLTAQWLMVPVVVVVVMVVMMDTPAPAHICIDIQRDSRFIISAAAMAENFLLICLVTVRFVCVCVCVIRKRSVSWSICAHSTKAAHNYIMCFNRLIFFFFFFFCCCCCFQIFCLILIDRLSSQRRRWWWRWFLYRASYHH